MTVGFQILCAALANILTSSSLSIFNAWIFRQGYHYQFSLLAMQQVVCSAFAAIQVSYLPGEAGKVKITAKNYFRMVLPYGFVVALKLYVQNKAFEHVSPAFYAMIASTLPVGVTMLAMVRGIEPFRLSTLCAAVLVSVGGCMIEKGEVSLSPFGMVLTVSALCLDVVRLVLVQYLVQPLKLSGPSCMLLTSPIQCLICAIGGALFESTEIATSISAGRFHIVVWYVLLLNCGLAMIVNLITFVFVKVSSAVVVAITTPFKDLCIVLMSDTMVVQRQETMMSISGFTIACTTSLFFNIHNIYRKERERVEQVECASLIPKRQEKTPGYIVPPVEEEEHEGEMEITQPWRVNDAFNTLIMCCSMGILVLACTVIVQVIYI